jgi:hypothetical protein
MNFNSIRRVCVAAASAVALVAMTGCAHQVSMSPAAKDLAVASKKINKPVAYLITPADMAKEVQTPGGGGDKVKYQPYHDLDAALYQAFSGAFSDVSKVGSLAEATGVSYVITPTITTTSSSDSMLTWPPTQFTVELVCQVTDAKGVTLTEVRGSGKGAATFSEFKSDFSLAARRASKEAVDNLVKALDASEPLHR